MNNDSHLREVVDAYVETKLTYLALEEQLQHLKEMLKVDSELVMEEMIQSGQKTYKHICGNVTLKNNVFGSVKKRDGEDLDLAKTRVIRVLEQDSEFRSHVCYEPSFNSKTLGSAIRDKRDTAMVVWQALQASGQPTVKEFNASLYLPQNLIEVLNVSEEFTVVFTPIKDK